MPDVASLSVPEAPPALSTPADRIFDESITLPSQNEAGSCRSDVETIDIYEIERTAAAIVRGQWQRVALQFPDDLLADAARVSRLLDAFLHGKHSPEIINRSNAKDSIDTSPGTPSQVVEKIFILADTSYGACCVDEIAAEHADADVVIHYGRTCLSPTSRLPVVYVFTKQPLSSDLVVQAFQATYPDRSERVILMADLPYQHQLSVVSRKLESLGYSSIFPTSVVHDAQSPLPNRTYPSSTPEQASLKDWALFHVAEPTPSLLLNIASRVRAITFFPIHSTPASTSAYPQALQANTATSLRRRYGVLTSLSPVAIFGILINTLSVRNYLEILDQVKKIIARAGKKSYTFVVGKVNAAKIANFSEIGGWVVIGCWESSLFDTQDFWKPIITPFELELALRSDDKRVWTGQWVSDFQKVLDARASHDEVTPDSEHTSPKILCTQEAEDLKQPWTAEGISSPDESIPPEFDLRNGRYVSQSRPMATSESEGIFSLSPGSESASTAVSQKPKGDLTTIAGQLSPAASFFRNQRSWRGLGSEFDVESNDSVNFAESNGAKMELGRHGVARGYRIEQDKSAR